LSNHQFKQKKEDEYYTKEYAIIPLLKYIKKEHTVWCPFDKKESNFYKIFSNNGNPVIASHIDDGLDFFEYKPDVFDLIVSNPPYSRREEVILRLFSLNKPFAILINDAGLFDSINRYDVLSKNTFEIMVFNKRIDYIKPENPNMKGVPFKSIYLCHNFLPSQFVFEKI
jgi:hypothetical protein